MRNIFGLIIVLFGLGLLLQQFNVPGAESIMSAWWPLVVIAVGVLAWNGNRRHVFGPAMIILVGVIMLLDQLNLFSQSAWNLFWPIVVIAAGLRIVLGKSWMPGGQVDSGSADVNVFFSGAERAVTGLVSKSEINAWFGGVKLDLRQAQFDEQSTIRVTAAFGGVDIFVPKTVRIISKVTPILGGTDDKTSPDANATKTLTIIGSAMFGGVSIKN